MQASLSIGSDNLHEPVKITFKDKKLKIISNNIPSKAIFSILKRSALLKGHFMLDANVDLNASPPAVTASLHSVDLAPLQNDPLARKLNLTRPVRLDLSVHNVRHRYFASLDIDSQLLRTHKTKIDFDSTTMIATLRSTLTDIALPGYNSDKIILRSTIDINRSIVSDTAFSSDFEHLDIPSLYYGDNMLGDFSFSARNLNRFAADINRSFIIKGQGRIARRNNKTAIHADTNLLGPVHASFVDDTVKLRLTDFDLLPLFQILKRPAVLQGTLRSTLQFENGALLSLIHI